MNIAAWLHDENCPGVLDPEACTCSEPRETQLDWVIAGGESGPRARPMHPDWARSLRDQCATADVAFHFKQQGEWSWGDFRPKPKIRRATPIGVDTARRLLAHRR